MIDLFEFLFNTWVPFLISFVLIYGVLEGIKIFNRRINFMISLLLSLAFLTSPAFKIFSEIFTSYAAFFVIATLVAVFIVGSLVHGGRKIIQIEKRELEERLKAVNEKIRKKEEELERARREGKEEQAAQISKELEDLKRKKSEIEERLRRI